MCESKKESGGKQQQQTNKQTKFGFFTALIFLVLNLYIFIFPVIKEEAIDSRAEVKSFDQSKLKHVDTAEKNPLPTQQSKRPFY